MRLEDVDYSDPTMVYFATLCTRDKEQVFLNEQLARETVASLMWCREQNWFSLYAYCLMPEHLHVAVSPREATMSVSDSIGRFKSFTTTISWRFELTGQLWQRSWYDHIARRDEDLLSICEYIINNPVRRGLVETAEMWPYSGMPDPLPF